MSELLERDMEEAVARCPDIFIQAGLHFVGRQIVLNGRRPDILFEAVLGRHLLVELQRGQPEEEHLPRHVDYFYDYRAKYPETHPRLMFLANRVIPQHKEFLERGRKSQQIPSWASQRPFDKEVEGSCPGTAGRTSWSEVYCR